MVEFKSLIVDENQWYIPKLPILKLLSIKLEQCKSQDAKAIEQDCESPSLQAEP